MSSGLSLEAASRIARAVLYEGYVLYPYHRESAKNRQRWTFGGVYPRSYVEANPGSDAAEQLTECLVEARSGRAGARIDARVRFLQLVAENGQDGSAWDRWETAEEREVALEDLPLETLLREPLVREFSFPALREGGRRRERIEGRIELRAYGLERGVSRLQLRVSNACRESLPERSEALLRTLVSTHSVLSARLASFVSLLDPPDPLKPQTQACRNVGTYPVLLGAPGDRSMVLSSPIILYDYPKIAPESPGELFDGLEIDEILSLRILTLSDEEKARVRAADEKSRKLLERTEALTEDEWLGLHGRLRDVTCEYRPGDRVRLKPKKRADAIDGMLAGMIARVEAVEQDLEGGVHLAVTLEDDPGRDLGASGFPGHRFFFQPAEVERA